MLGIRALVLLAVLVWASPAQAQFGRMGSWQADGIIRLDLEYQRREDPATAGGLADTVRGGFSLIGAFGPGRLGLLAGLDVHVGAGLQGGVAYDLNLVPLGVGLRAGRSLLVGAGIGIGVSAVTRHVPAAMQAPLDVIVELDLHSRVHLSAWGRGKWMASSERRKDGAESVSVFDELEAGVALRLGKGRRKQSGSQWGNGYFVAGTYSEQLGTRSVGAMIGYSITAGFRPPRRRRSHQRFGPVPTSISAIAGASAIVEADPPRADR